MGGWAKVAETVSKSSTKTAKDLGTPLVKGAVRDSRESKVDRLFMSLLGFKGQ
ncbi:hypothetical protein MARINOS108_20193 [Marinoscillum sp. 108]|nr:hypothetical protein MARINOS108_20193 [Marinoscillum sp. 108]